ncbi:hypothetical protein LH506_04625 [Lapidilactobacillus dextrinicus]|uniref:hypothetical protein n=1 Tax=Lapidilactobacillus dextrinicus TaxID=51664 RepID=UPI00070EAD32|nr:hypothetical protein [Lapidilactobacillus dextrinicus]QFG46775.1 hypothetical protein LH506_04625 [Lapidilactobacillus dextrinicus]
MSKLDHRWHQLIVSLVVLTISLLIMQRLLNWPWLIYLVLASAIVTIISLIVLLVYDWLLH